MSHPAGRALLLVPLLALSACGGAEARPRLILGTTHTLEDSGLLEPLVEGFRQARPEYEFQVVVAGSGEVLEYGRRGDVDVLLTHSPEAELELARHGWLRGRSLVMHNDFVLLGPPADPAGVAGAPDALAAFRRLRDARARFVSRGDDSGTHRKERALWFAVGVMPQWPEYVEAGVGMADALRIAAQRSGYILSDRATFVHLQRELSLRVLFEGDPVLRNQYAVSRAARARNPEGARAFGEWITGEAGQALIGAYGRAQHGHRLFIPDAAADTAGRLRPEW